MFTLSLRGRIKALISLEGLDQKDVVRMLNEKYNEKNSDQSFSNKLRRGNPSYKDIEKILDVLGYEIKWIKKEKDQQE